MQQGDEVPEHERWNRNIHYHRLLLDLGPCERALDVGCGGGMLTRQLAAVAGRVVGIDKHDASIASARAATTHENVRYINGDVLTEPLQAESFDLVVSVLALHHFDAAAGLARFAQLLRPGGRLGVIGVGRSRYPRDLARDCVARIATELTVRSQRKKVWAHSAPMVWPPEHTDREMAELSVRVLPGAEFRRLLHGRHSILWTKPEA